jgi:hypothetical protein
MVSRLSSLIKSLMASLLSSVKRVDDGMSEDGFND